MLDLFDLLDYLQDDTEITIFDLDACEDIEKDLSIEEARRWLERHAYELESIEPTPQEGYHRGITLNLRSFI